MITRRSLIELFLASPIAYLFNISPKDKLSPTYVHPINPVLKDQYGTVQYYTFQFDSEQPAINKKHCRMLGFPAKQVVEITYKQDDYPQCIITYTYGCFTDKPYFDIAKFINSEMIGAEHVYKGMPEPYRMVDGDKYTLLSINYCGDEFFEGN